jgi:hypothetical protein
MHPVEDIGLVKIDLLGNRGLSAIADRNLLRERGASDHWARDERAEGARRAGAVSVRHEPFRDPARCGSCARAHDGLLLYRVPSMRRS